MSLGSGFLKSFFGPVWILFYFFLLHCHTVALPGDTAADRQEIFKRALLLTGLKKWISHLII